MISRLLILGLLAFMAYELYALNLKAYYMNARLRNINLSTQSSSEDVDDW